MIAKLIVGSNIGDLASYLAGPGRANEHFDQQIVATSHELTEQYQPGMRLDEYSALQLGSQLATPYIDFGSPHTHKIGPKPAEGMPDFRRKMPTTTWHLILSCPPGEFLDAETWAGIARDMVAALGVEGDSTEAPWAAIWHGWGKNENDHLHIAVSYIRPDGTTLNDSLIHKRIKKARLACEDKYGLQPNENERARRAQADYSYVEKARADANGEMMYQHQLKRAVQVAAQISGSEAEFVTYLRASGVVAVPYWEKGGREHASGYKVKLSSRDDDCPWYSGTRLSRTLSLPRLRQTYGWADDDTARAQARDAWLFAWREGPKPKLSEPKWQQSQIDMAADDTFIHVSNIPPDSEEWDAHTRSLGTIFAAASRQLEGNQPGKLWDAAQACYRYGEIKSPALDLGRIGKMQMLITAKILATVNRQHDDYSIDIWRNMIYTLRILQLYNQVIEKQKELSGQLQALREIRVKTADAHQILEAWAVANFNRTLDEAGASNLERGREWSTLIYRPIIGEAYDYYPSNLEEIIDEQLDYAQTFFLLHREEQPAPTPVQKPVTKPAPEPEAEPFERPVHKHRHPAPLPPPAGPAPSYTL